MLKHCVVGILIAALCVMAGAGKAQAVTTTTVSFVPSPPDLYDLNHDYYYSWGIRYQISSGLDIVGAVLSFDNLNNTQTGTNRLSIHLLDNPLTGVRYGYDNSSGGDYWAGKGPLIANFVDSDIHHSQDISYDLGALGLLPTLKTYAADGIWGFGLDPDCHYVNDGVCLKIMLQPGQAGQEPTVPEPVTMASVLLAIGAVVGYARRRLLTR